MLSKKRRHIPLYLFLAAVFLNLAAWSSPSFCDFYAAHFFPIIVECYGRLTGLFPFSIGEWMLLAAVLLLGAVLGGGIMCLVGRRFYSWYLRYIHVCIWMASVVCLVMTLNCLILYHCSPIDLSHSAGSEREQGYGTEELIVLRNYVVTQANRLAELVPRDDRGYVIYQGTAGHPDMISLARAEMSRLGEQYPRLSGYYPRPKPFMNSAFFSQQYICGYYFPFSMEANYNAVMYPVNTPVTLCHELSHLKGFIYEDEANLIGYLACVDSENLLFQYSAYLSVIGYLERDFYAAVDNHAAVIASHPAVSEAVIRDDVFLTPEAWVLVEESAFLDTQLVSEVSGEIIEANLTLNGVADGTASYGRVVELLLQYYTGILWT